MDYSKYWSLLDSPSESIKSGTICFFFGLGAGILWLLTKRFYKDKSERGTILWGTGLFSIIAIIGYLLLTFVYVEKPSELTLKMLNSPDTPVAEGIITDFSRSYRVTRFGRITTEEFFVNGIHFAYSDELMSGFNSFSETYNKVIFNGQRVRITYQSISNGDCNRNEILKIEIAK